MALLQDVYGDAASRQETAVEDAVKTIEHTGFRAYGALQQLAREGKVRPAKAAPAAPSQPPVSVDPTEADFSLSPEPSAAVISGMGAEFHDPGRTYTHIVVRPKKPPKR